MRPFLTTALVIGYVLAVLAVLWGVKTLVLLSIPTVLIVLGCGACILLLVALSIFAFKLFQSINLSSR